MKKGKVAPVRIEKIRIRELQHFARNLPAGNDKDNLIPITPARALAQSRNPSADENDIGLLVAYVGEQCAGYCGFIPGWLKNGDQISKVYWSSALFVLPEFRKKGVGLYLIRRGTRLNYDFVSCNLSRVAERVVRGLGHREIGGLEYYILSFKRMGTVAKNYFYHGLFRRRKRTRREINYREVGRIRFPEEHPPRHNPATVEFYRSEETINWMLRYKWLVETAAREEISSNYIFSDARDIFKYIALEVYSADKTSYKGFLVLSVSSVNSETTVKILDFCFADPADHRHILPLALRYARAYRADFVHLPGDIFALDKHNILMRFLAHKKKRIYLAHPKDSHSPLAVSFNRITLNYCDGDTAFT